MKLSRSFAVFLLLLTGLALWLWQNRQPNDGATTVERMAKAFEERRPFEARLTGFGAHAPCGSASDPKRFLPRILCSPPPAPGTPEQKTLREALLWPRGKAGRMERASDLHEEAISRLLLSSRTDDLDSVVRTLEAAVEKSPRDARLLNDLAVAYSVRAQETDEPHDLVRALEAATRARDADPDLLEASFNLALLLDRLHLRHMAETAWKAYQDLDPNSDWTGEAGERLHELDQPSLPERWKGELPNLRTATLRGDVATVRRIVEIDPQAAREYAIENLLGEWGELTLAGQSLRAVTALETVRTIGRALQEISGDGFILEVAQTIGQEQNEGDAETLARGHRAYRDGSALFRAASTLESEPFLREARVAFSRVQDPTELWALAGLAGVELYRSRFEDAIRTFESIAMREEAKGHLALLGRMHWGMGLVDFRQGRFSQALHHYRQAASLFERARERENLGALQGLIAENLRFLGQSSLAWRHRYRAVSHLDAYPASIRLHNVLWEGGKGALEEGMPRAALFFQNEGLIVARKAAQPTPLPEAFRWRSDIFLALGRLDEALADLDRARRLNEDVPGEAARERLRLELLLLEGRIASQRRSPRAPELLAEALQEFRQLGLTFKVIEATLNQSRALRRAGRWKETEAHLRSAIDLFETQRALVADDDLRQSYSEAAQELFDEMILLQWTENDRPDAAFEVSEQARTLPVGRSSGREKVSDLSPVTPDSLPPKTIFVEYALVRDRLLTWSLRNGVLSSAERRVDSREIERMVASFSLALGGRRPERELESLSAVLSDLLIPKAVRELSGTHRVVFVPDKVLHAVPFAALRNPATGQYLVEEHVIVISPSVRSTLAGWHDRPHSFEPGAAVFGFIGNPAFERALFPALEDLPEVEEEVKVVRHLYRHPSVIVGRAATRKAFLEMLPRFSVVEYAGHSIFNARHPAYSYFVLAPSTGDDGILFGHEIADLSLSGLDLVVLSACNTLGAADSRIAGLSGMARFFLDAGAGAVVGTLWNVDDRESTELMREFHRVYLQKGDAALALREAQLSVIRKSGGSPESRPWAAFEVVD